LPDQVTQHFTSCATEFNTTRDLHKLLNGDATNAINAVVDEAISKKDKLITEEGAAELTQIVAAAAQLAAACFSWAPGINLGLEATVVALFATATGLEFDAAKYEKSVIDYISNMNNEVVNEPGMETVKTWQTAVSANGAFYPRLDLGLAINAQRAIMQSIPTGIQQHKLGYVDADGYKAYIKTIGEFIYNNQDIVDQYERLLASIDNSTTPKEIKDRKIEIASAIPGFNVTEAAEMLDTVMDVITFTLAFKDSIKWYKTRRTVAEAADSPIDAVNEKGDVDPALAGPEAVAAEETWLNKAGSFLGDAIAGLGAVAGIILGEIAVVETAKLDEELTLNIGYMKGNLTDYYDDVIKNAPRRPNSSKTNSSSSLAAKRQRK